MTQSGTDNARRNSKGNVYILVIGCIGLLLAIALMLFQVQMYFLKRQNARYASQAAALEAANQLSKIVVSDSKWGFVSLSNHTASGKGTIAGDGQPLPVIGVNNVIATVRLEKLLAQQFGNARIDSQANLDYEVSQKTIKSLQEKLDEAVSWPVHDRTPNFRDKNGSIVHAKLAALKIFEKNFPDIKAGKAVVSKFNLTLGWLEGGSSTVTPSPTRTNSKGLDGEDFYTSFKNLPVGDKEFYFAGTSGKSRLIDANRFKASDGKRFCSAVLLEAKIDYPSVAKNKNSKSKPTLSFYVRSVAIPASSPYLGAGGTMVVACPQGKIDKFNSLVELVSCNDFDRYKVHQQVAQGGDFPVDHGAFLKTTSQTGSQTVSESMTKSLLAWLRTNYGRASLASIDQALRAPISINPSQTGTLAMFDFDKNGEVKVSHFENHGFRKQTVSDKQTLNTAYNLVSTNKGMLGITVRDHVRNLSTVNGGKHAGQPLTEELPLDYSLPIFREKEIAKQASQSETDSLNSFRKSYLKGGLAVSVELSAVQIASN